MITAALSTLLGMLGGVLPDIMKEVRDSRNATREIEHMRTQAELQLKVAQANADSRLREIDANVFVEEAKAFREHLAAILESQAKPTGILWVDAFNALLRPVCVTLIMMIFTVGAMLLTFAAVGQFWSGLLDADAAVKMIFGGLVGESILATLGFLFGYRSAAKRPGAV